MSKPLRALLLAAGLGTRLRPLTLQTPKCLVTIGGEPLLGCWLRQLEAAGCEAVLVNTHYLADQVVAYLASWQGRTMAVESVHEPELLGTAGTLAANREFFAGATGLLIHADNAMGGELPGLLAAHGQRPSGCLLTMLTFQSDQPSSCGIVETDGQGVVQGFHEKVVMPPGNCANGAMYAFDQPFMDWFCSMDQHISDFSTGVIPRLMGQIYTWPASGAYLDIGTPESLRQAQQIWPQPDGARP
jgi:mannose-1-phosphate guanylyltransferase